MAHSPGVKTHDHRCRSDCQSRHWSARKAVAVTSAKISSKRAKRLEKSISQSGKVRDGNMEIKQVPKVKIREDLQQIIEEMK